MRTILITTIAALALSACGEKTVTQNPLNSTAPTNRPASQHTSPVIPKDGNYPARGTVTKINLENGSIELDHEDIPGVMPPMRMEFNVRDKGMLKGLKAGDAVDFTLEYKHPAETIVAIRKTE